MTWRPWQGNHQENQRNGSGLVGRLSSGRVVRNEQQITRTPVGGGGGRPRPRPKSHRMAIQECSSIRCCAIVGIVRSNENNHWMDCGLEKIIQRAMETQLQCRGRPRGKGNSKEAKENEWKSVKLTELKRSDMARSQSSRRSRQTSK